MKKNVIFKYLSIFAFALLILNSCQNENEQEAVLEAEVPAEILEKLAEADFDISNAKLTSMFGEQGVAVEDMFFSYAELEDMATTPSETGRHYRTTRLVTSLPRVITISVDPNLGSLGSNALNDAVSMYNGVNFQLSFERVAFGLKGRNAADIEVTEFSEQPSGGFITLGRAAGFPTRKGDPAKGFGINSVWFSLLNPSQADVAGTMAHEIGHCIGLRHTDYQTRESCGQNVNEGSAGVGAIYINGSPTGSDTTSLMQSCGPASNFNNNDRNALQVIY